jgi:deoxyribonuclease-4
LRLGFHVSIAGSIDRAVDRAKEKGCNTFQIFTRNPRGWKFKELVEDEVNEFVKKVAQYGIDQPIAHMPYLPNLASPKDDLYEKSVQSLIFDLERCGRLNIPYLVTHLGSHLGAGEKVGWTRIINGCNKALKQVSNSVMLLLENTAGQKNSLGTTFEDLKYIMTQIQLNERVAICFDTCHAFAAGYNLRNKDAVRETLNRFEEVIGFERLKVIHLNDSMGGLGCRLDRHEHIGLGYIGEEGFRAVLHHAVLRDLPLILETPIDSRRDDDGNLQKIQELYQE